MINEKKIVLVFDICSSTVILEDLNRTDNINRWRDFIAQVNKFLNFERMRTPFIPYKFLGDGWIILFKYDHPGSRIINFAESLGKKINGLLDANILKILEEKPTVSGITIGMDRGTLVRLLINNNKEYVGRPINVACRLQSAIKYNDQQPQNKILMTRHLYDYMKSDLSTHDCFSAKRILRNIAGDRPIGCMKVNLKISMPSKIKPPRKLFRPRPIKKPT